MRAYYFSGKDKRLRYGDNRLIQEGETHTVDCEPILCEQGLHGSIKALDALKYAPDTYLWIVEIEGDIQTGEDKICGKSRTYIKGFDAEELLRSFACKQALINIEKIKPYCSEEEYNTILAYLHGDYTARAAAEAAARATWTAAEEEAWEAARVARAARAAWTAAEAAAAAARTAARSAAETAARSAAEAAAEAAARGDAWTAAWTAAEAAANGMLEELIQEELNNAS